MRQAGSRRQWVSPFEKLFSLAVYRSIYISSRHCHVIKRIPISPNNVFYLLYHHFMSKNIVRDISLQM